MHSYQVGRTRSVTKAALANDACRLSAKSTAVPSRPNKSAAAAFCALNTNGDARNAARCASAAGDVTSAQSASV